MRKLYEEQKERAERLRKQRLANRARRQGRVKGPAVPLSPAQRARQREKTGRGREYFFGDGARIAVFLPDVLSLADNYEATMTAIARIRRSVLRQRQKVMLHFENVKMIEPAAAIVLAAEVFRCQKSSPFKGEAVHGTYPANHMVEQKLTQMGFFSLIDVEDRLDRPKYAVGDPLFLPFQTATNVPSEMLDKLVSTIEKYDILQLNDVARAALIGALIEAVSNAHEHGYKQTGKYPALKSRWWMLASIDPHLHEVRVILFDQGVGIPKTLNFSLFERVSTDWANLLRLRLGDGVTIKAATELFRTSTGQGGRGRGFRDMKRFVDQCDDGELRVLSNRGWYHYIAGTEGFGDGSSSLGGTLVEWRIRNGGSLVMEDA